jgi:hypothetical protein
MRIRKVEVDWGNGKAALDCRHENNRCLPVIGLLGPTASGRTMLMKSVIRLFRNAMYDGTSFHDWKQVSCSVEFDLGSAISTGVIRSGEVVQKLVYPEMKFEQYKLTGGILVYGSEQRCHFAVKDESPRCFGESLIYTVLNDLYMGKVSNSVIWVDDFALGLDDDMAREYLRVLIRKSMEGDNQLIVSTDREVLLQGVGAEGIRVLGSSGTNVVERVLKSLK